MAEAQVVDIASDPLDQRHRLRRRLLRIGLPIAGVLLVIAAILAIAVHSYHANRRGALALSDDLLEALDGRVAQQVGAWLDPAARVTIGKRLSDRIYLTYSRSLSSSTRDQIILLEYDQTDRFSWILSRNEDAQTYALEFRLRRVF